MQTTTPRTLIIGLDGATFDLLDPMIRAGDLPNLARLIEEGAHCPLQTWPNTNSAAAWSSMVTGYNSGHHNIFHFSGDLNQHDAGIGWKPITAADRRKPAFWHTLSAAGQRVGVVNVPITYPAADLTGGFMIAGMDAPGLDSPGLARPRRLLDDLRRQGIDYIIDAPNLGVAARQDRYQLPDVVRRMIDARGRTILHLMQAEAWDVLMAVFVATDRVQHYFWPRDLADVSAPDWQPIREVYRQIDEFFGRLLALTDEDTTVLVVSDHGFGRSLPAKRCLNQLFAELGLLRFRKSAGNVKNRMLKRLLKSGRQRLPDALQTRLARALPALHLRAVNAHGKLTIDWSATRAFASNTGSRVWVNLEGREETGMVPSGDYEALREQLSQVLLHITDAATGRPVVRAVHKREDLYRGPFANNAPDLIVEWDHEASREEMPCDGLSYNNGARVITVKPEPGSQRGNRWSGSHRPYGIFIARGTHIRQGVTLDNANIYDIAATVLYLQGRPVPKDMDGKVLTAMFTDEWRRRHPVQEGESPVSETPAADGDDAELETLDAEDARRIEERLRGLGYIE